MELSGKVNHSTSEALSLKGRFVGIFEEEPQSGHRLVLLAARRAGLC